MKWSTLLRENYTIFGIIAVATIVFLLQQLSEDELVPGYAAVPALVSAAWDQFLQTGPTMESVAGLSRLFTACLLHGDPEHLLFNMVYLWAFGALASRHIGPWWSVAVFVLTGVAGMIAQVALNRESIVPILGASGAVCGFEGLYLGLALRWDMDWPDVWPLAHPIPPLQLGAFAVLGFCVDAYGLMRHEQGIAFGAHIGGLLAGILIALILTAVFPTERSFAKSLRV